MNETVFARRGVWIPKVVRQDGELRVQLGAGADALHSPRTFSFPISETHLDVIRRDLRRHLLLWAAILPLCDAAGISAPLDEAAAVALLDPILLGTQADVDAFFRESQVKTTMLVGYGADVELLERGQLVDSLRHATEESDTARLRTYVADRERARRGVRLGPLDEAILHYTGQYLHASTLPRRRPGAVDPALLAEVLTVIATAEQAGSGMRIRRDPRRGKRSTDKGDWNRMQMAVDAAVRGAHPGLLDDSVRSVTFLVCSEAAARSRDRSVDDDETTPATDDAGAAKTALTFTDDRGAESTWRLGDRRTAFGEFWEFVADHSGSGDEVFTIEDQRLGEGIQLHLGADSVARVTTVEGTKGTDPQYRVEYGLVDGMDGYRSVVSAFVRGGCAALDRLGPWMPDVEELERARRRRDAGERQ